MSSLVTWLCQICIISVLLLILTCAPHILETSHRSLLTPHSARWARCCPRWPSGARLYRLLQRAPLNTAKRTSTVVVVVVSQVIHGVWLYTRFWKGNLLTLRETCNVGKWKMGLHLYSAFIQRVLQYSLTFMQRQRCQPCKIRTNTSGAVRCLVQWHLDPLQDGAQGSNQQPSCCQTIALTSWATAIVKQITAWHFPNKTFELCTCVLAAATFLFFFFFFFFTLAPLCRRWKMEDVTYR